MGQAARERLSNQSAFRQELARDWGPVIPLPLPLTLFSWTEGLLGVK